MICLTSDWSFDEVRYRIHYFGKYRETGSEPWDGTLFGAKTHGVRAVEDGAAERIEIRDEKGGLAFGYPSLVAAP